jgi:hypothetical protein
LQPASAAAAISIKTSDGPASEFLGPRRFQLTADPNQSAAAVAVAMKEAEAAQQALLISGRVAEQAGQACVLREVVCCYVTVQLLYHKAMLPLLQRHQQLSGSPAGLAYALLCEALGQQPVKQLGDYITTAELQQLALQVQQLPSLVARHPLTLLGVEFATMLGDAPPAMRLSTLDVCVMPDTISLLAGYTSELLLERKPSETSAGLSALLGAVATKAGQLAKEQLSSARMSLEKPLVEEMLIEACKPPGSPAVYNPAALTICSSTETMLR